MNYKVPCDARCKSLCKGHVRKLQILGLKLMREVHHLAVRIDILDVDARLVRVHWLKVSQHTLEEH